MSKKELGFMQMPLPGGENKTKTQGQSFNMPLPQGGNRTKDAVQGFNMPLPQGENRTKEIEQSLKMPLPQGENRKEKADAILKSLKTEIPLPKDQQSVVKKKLEWSGLNKAHMIDTGELSLEENISTLEAPYLTPSPKRVGVRDNIINKATGYSGATPIGLFGFDNFLILIYRAGNVNRIAHITNIDGNAGVKNGVLNSNIASTEQRCVVMFNVFKGNPLDGTCDKKLAIFPDKMSMDFIPSGSSFNPAEIAHMPNIKYATVYLSRIFGVGAGTNSHAPDRLFVSGFNDYTNWNLDTASEYNSANAWVSAAQSNVKATGEFTGITTYLNSVVAFKKDYMHEVTGNQNPFRINDIYAEGATDNRNIVEVDGNLIFASEDAIKIYTGGNPRIISYKLGINRLNNAIAGNDGRRYYLYCEDEKKHLFVYDTLIMQWAEESINERVLSFAKNSMGFYMLTDNGSIYRIDSGEYDGQSWAAETDLSAGHTIDIKHIQKIQMLADVAPYASINADLIYDNNRTTQVYSYTNDTDEQKTITIRVTPRQTAHWGAKLRLYGTGFSRVYQAEIMLKSGGELFA